MKRVCLFLSGEVQGVGMRYSIRSKADSLGLCGWVKNLDDGRVVCVAEGGDAAIKELTKWLMDGRFKDNITDMDIKEEKPGNEFSGFEIKY